MTATYEIRNPADAREVVGEAPALDAAGVERALARAHDAQRVWRRTPIVERAEILRRAGAAVRACADELATGVTREIGKLLAESRVEAAKTADFLEYYASFGRRPVGEILPDARPGAEARTVREPRGVVVAIAPWNDPLITPARKLAPALVTGNAVVLKAAPESPLTALSLARILAGAGLPEGVLEVVTGPGDEVSRQLVAADGYDALTFTGSTETGREVRRTLAGRNIPLQTEMGGKNAAVVLEDANLDLAVDALAAGAFAQAGQRCTATSRVLVERRVYGTLLRRLSERASGIRVGPGLDGASTMGPLVAEPRLEAALASVDAARGDGAELVEGGVRADGDGLSHGWFLRPTLLEVPAETNVAWREELFAPVAALMPFDGLDTAIELVNGTAYGLSAAIFTRDLEAAHHFAAEVDAGCIAVNLPTAGWDVHLPFGGFRESGSPFKEQGVEAFAFCTRVKTVAMRTAGLTA